MQTECKPNAVLAQTCDFTNDTTDIEIDFDGYDSSKVSYNDLVLRCTELCRTVANDQKKCRSVMNGVIQWTNKLRMKQPFNMFF